MIFFNKKTKKNEFDGLWNERKHKLIESLMVDDDYKKCVYANTIRLVNGKYGEYDNKNDIIDYIISIIKNELKYSYMSQVLYLDTNIAYEHLYPQPHMISDFIIPNELYKTCGKIDINFNDESKTIITIPWKNTSLIHNISKIDKVGFRYIDTNHKGFYFKGLDIGYIINGFHSTAVGILKKQGNIVLKLVDDSIAFEKLTTDGACWYFDDRKMSVVDVRTAILFELNRLKISNSI